INSLGNNVLIGTTTDAGFKLDVNGTARTGALTAGALDLSGQIDLNNNNIIAGGTAAFTTVTAALSGNASTATLLQNSRTINGVAFNGGSNITVTAAAGTLTGTTLKSTVVTSSLTTVGTIATGVWQGTSIGTTWTDAKVTSIVAGTLIDVSAATGDVTVNVDLSELTTSVTNGDGDFFVVVDAANAQSKLTKANINLSGMNNDSGWTSNTGTVTSVSGTSSRISSTGGATPVIDIDAAYVGQTSITTLGTIATGVWSGTAILWAKVNKSGSVLADIANVTITTIATGEILKWSGSAWINNTLAEASISAVGHAHAAGDITSGILSVTRGGTGLADPTAGKILLGAGASAMTQLDFGAAGGYVRSTGAAWARSGLLAADLTGTVASARLSGVYSSITGLGTQAQALDMGAQNITNVGTYSGGAISTTGTFTLSSTQPVLDFNET
ncbi:hypothetical protein LCGC14_2675420, partial [marine sediment metagenome]